MTFNFFVLPFFLGLIFLLYYVIKQYSLWIRSLDKADRIRFSSGIRSRKTFSALKEIFFESLLHRRMFRKNFLLGYMHMSFAFGWLLLIVMGNMESRIYSGLWVNPPYYPIFLKFFIHDKRVLPFEIFTVPGFFRFSMDLILVFIIFGLILALVKRRRSKWFGLKTTTHLQLTDKVAMTCLWLIFPLRLAAESFTAGAYGYGGGFVTQHLGNVLAMLWPFSDKFIAYASWWLYSLSLGVFFITLPYSRYMHIPTELMLIFFRTFGIKPKKENAVFAEVEVYSCPRCGLCLDVCQLATAADIRDIQSVYFIKAIREQAVSGDVALKCLMCGRCMEVCPVGIHTDSLRLIQRSRFYGDQHLDHRYLPAMTPEQTDVVYFAGCMSHLTPGITRSMKKILQKAGINYLFLDEERTICCGRPLMLSGRDSQARAMIEANKKLIRESGAKLLVTSCPICYRVFREDYKLQIEVIHHSEFLLQLIKKGKLPIQSYFRKVAYHDPCELGRGTGVYSGPRELLGKVADLLDVPNDRNDSLCCGGSLGILNLGNEQRDLITQDAISNLLTGDPELIVTSCPLCKKTFTRHSPVDVVDIAEIVADAIPVGITG
jgi:Fe-S oxidoreductase